MIEHCATLVRNTPLPRMNNYAIEVIKGIKRKVREEGLIITKADKSNTIVVMEKSSYVSKVYDVLDQCGAKENDSFNFLKHVKEVRREINKCKFIIKTPSLKKLLLEPNPVPPLLYGLPKVHKKDNPMRPVVSFVSSPTYALAKYLDR